MGTLFRSEDMTLCQLYLQSEAAYSVVCQLGELAVVQFRDLNEETSAYTKKFVNEIRRTDEMERQLRYFEREIKEERIEPAELVSYPEAPAPREMIDLEATFEKHESELKELSNNIDALKHNYIELYELKFVLRYTEDFMVESDFNFMGNVDGAQGATGDVEMTQMESGMSSDAQRKIYLGYVAGVIPMEKLNGFMRLLWFACRGNVFVRHVDIMEPLEDVSTGSQTHKAVFMVFFQGETLKSKIKKICEGYKATLYPCPESADERREMAIGVLARLQDLETVLGRSKEQRERVLRSVAKNLPAWFIKVLKIKAIYHTMNMFNSDGQNYVAECYLPTADMNTVQSVIQKATTDIGVSAPSLLHPIPSTSLPTYFRANKFTTAYQSIINAYGVASYKEVNPAPFTIITFPFLFAVMFGDFGHGLLMFIFALWMCIRERGLEKTAKNNEMFGMIFAGRYIVLLMGAFSLYTGLIYNDCFSKSINIFGCRWNIIYDDEYIHTHETMKLDASDSKVYGGTMYPFGMDPIWQIAKNKITFTNSYKEKMSVIVGVSHMLFGVILSIFNHVHLKRTVNIWTQFLPEIMFLLCMFGYMDLLIITKWIKYDASDSSCAPNILIGYINMFLFSYPDNDTLICSSRTWYSGQKGFQTFLVIWSLVCALWMLAAKPAYLYLQHRKRSQASYQQVDAPLQAYRALLFARKEELYTGGTSQLLLQDQFLDIEHAPGETRTDDEDLITDANDVTLTSTTSAQSAQPPAVVEEFQFGDVMINQVIHTIEFCLGCVSHTASYLRLWALSLAHSQLSEVLWNMILRMGFKVSGYGGFVMIFLVFPAWAGGTVGILLVMEGLSAFLHTIRLHWVEFQSKFYKGEGFIFVPFNFREMIENSEHDF